MKRFKITFEYWDAVLEIDLTAAAAVCKCSNEFFSGSDFRLMQHDDNHVLAWLELLAPVLIELSQHYRLDGIIKHVAKTEGFFPIDGSQGVKLIACDSFSFDKFEITEVPTSDKGGV